VRVGLLQLRAVTERRAPSRPTVEHRPLKPWSPWTAAERKERDAFLDRVLAPPFLTLGIIAILVWFYVVQLSLGWPFAWDLPGVGAVEGVLQAWVGAHLGALDAEAVWAGEGWRLVTATLLHASVLHIVGNCLVLFLLGRLIEHAYGPLAFVVTYIGSGVAGTTLSLLLLGHDSIGASGAVLGMLGACFAFGRKHRDRIPAALRDFFGLDLSIFVVLVALTSMLPFVDWAGHLGGGLFGFAMGWWWPPRVLGDRPSPQQFRALQILAGVALGALLFALSVVGVRLWSGGEDRPNNELRVLYSGLEDADGDRMMAAVDRLLARYPDLAMLEVSRVDLLLEAELFQRAATTAESVELRRPQVRGLGADWDNRVAWALLRGFPDDPPSVDRALMKARRAAAARPDPAIRNTLAWALHLDGQYKAAEEQFAALMKPWRPYHSDNAFMRTLSLLALGRGEEAKAMYERWSGLYPDGLLRADAEQALRDAGLLKDEESSASEAPTEGR
jgi:membrane associated rhomboid family serine protease